MVSYGLKLYTVAIVVFYRHCPLRGPNWLDSCYYNFQRKMFHSFYLTVQQSGIKSRIINRFGTQSKWQYSLRLGCKGVS